MIMVGATLAYTKLIKCFVDYMYSNSNLVDWKYTQ